jgi:Cu(I)/Ag(I) efflux system membrane fusion protein
MAISNDEAARPWSKVKAKAKKVPFLVVVFALGFVLKWAITSPTQPAASTHVHTAQAPEKKQVWTCSMHPAIKLPKPGLCPICNMDLIPLSVDETEMATSMRQLSVSENAKKLMDIEVAPVERKFVKATVRMVGKVDYDETKLAYITAWVPGRLDRLYVDYTGVPVNKGDHLVDLYSPELISAQEELLQAIEAVQNIGDTELNVMREMTGATLNAAREKLRLWGLTGEQVAKIETAGKVEDHITIYAPISGIVIHKNALEQMYVSTGTRLYTIADLSQVWIKLDAYESDLEWLRYGQQVEFTAVSHPGEVFRGTIIFIDPILNEKTRTVKVRVNVPNLEGKLKPGMFVKAIARSEVAAGGRIMDADLVGKWMCPMHPEIVKSTSGECDLCEMPLVQTENLGYVSADPEQVQKPLVIPISAALVTGTRAIVYVQVPDANKPTFEGREIVLGPKAGDYYLVRSGLQERELVVVKGSFKIDAELQIIAKPSMMTPEGAGGGGLHDHGPRDAQDEQAGQPLVELPVLSRYQIQTALDRAQGVEKAIASEDIAKVRAGFAALSEALKNVDMKLLTGHAHMLWKEYHMRLTNDAVEGSEAKAIEDARTVAKSLESNARSVRARFGLVYGRAAVTRPIINDVFRDQLGKVFAKYFSMQQALAADDAESAANAAKDTLKLLKSVDIGSLSGKDRDTWEKASTDLETILNKGGEAKEIKLLRESFHLLSQQLAAVARWFGSTGEKPFYILNCPMAFDNTGADWLQDNDQTSNPYFGAMMLKCGGVKEVIGLKDIWEKGNN